MSRKRCRSARSFWVCTSESLEARLLFRRQGASPFDGFAAKLRQGLQFPGGEGRVQQQFVLGGQAVGP